MKIELSIFGLKVIFISFKNAYNPCKNNVRPLKKRLNQSNPDLPERVLSSELGKLNQPYQRPPFSSDFDQLRT